jgi:hypothetical protein
LGGRSSAVTRQPHWDMRCVAVSRAPGVCALEVGMVLVDGEVIRRCPPQRNVAFEVR